VLPPSRLLGMRSVVLWFNGHRKVALALTHGPGILRLWTKKSGLELFPGQGEEVQLETAQPQPPVTKVR
jgi:hypothetical protein